MLPTILKLFLNIFSLIILHTCDTTGGSMVGLGLEKSRLRFDLEEAASGIGFISSGNIKYKKVKVLNSGGWNKWLLLMQMVRKYQGQQSLS